MNLNQAHKDLKQWKEKASMNWNKASKDLKQWKEKANGLDTLRLYLLKIHKFGIIGKNELLITDQENSPIKMQESLEGILPSPWIRNYMDDIHIVIGDIVLGITRSFITYKLKLFGYKIFKFRTCHEMEDDFIFHEKGDKVSYKYHPKKNVGTLYNPTIYKVHNRYQITKSDFLGIAKIYEKFLYQHAGKDLLDKIKILDRQPNLKAFIEEQTQLEKKIEEIKERDRLKIPAYPELELVPKMDIPGVQELNESYQNEFNQVYQRMKHKVLTLKENLQSQIPKEVALLEEQLQKSKTNQAITSERIITLEREISGYGNFATLDTFIVSCYTGYCNGNKKSPTIPALKDYMEKEGEYHIKECLP